DNMSVASVAVSNAATGWSGQATGTTSWSASVSLNSGTNLITVTARDGAGNPGTATMTVTYTPAGTAPTPGVVTASPQYQSFVKSPFDLSTSFNSASALTGCEYSVNGVWAPATVSGSAPSFTCTKTGITGTNGQALASNMRATNSGGTGTAVAIT